MRIDAHQHYWRYHPVRDAWITPDMAEIRRDFLPEQVAPELATSRIDGVIAVQADQSETETAFLLDLAAKHSFLVGVVGWIDLRARDLAEQLARWSRFPKLRGFRHVAQAEPDDFLARPEIVRAIGAIGAHGFSYDLLVYPRQLASAEQLVARCPEVQFVLDHCGKPPVASGDIGTWRSSVARIARHRNVSCKLSGLVTEADWGHWTDADLAPYLDVAATLFGSDRLLFGSDWPVCLVSAAYSDVIGVIDRWAGRLTPAERANIFGATAAAVYRLGD